MGAETQTTNMGYFKLLCVEKLVLRTSPTDNLAKGKSNPYRLSSSHGLRQTRESHIEAIHIHRILTGIKLTLQSK